MWITVAQQKNMLVYIHINVTEHNMPEFTMEAKLVAFIPRTFEKDGETIEYNECYFVSEDQDGVKSMTKVNSKQDLSNLEGKSGSVKIRMFNGKLSLSTFSTK